MNIQIGSIVTIDRFADNRIYRVICFFDRGNELACSKHQDIDPFEDADDVHLQLIWSNWPNSQNEIGDIYRVARFDTLVEPQNELLVLALAAS